MGEFIYNLPDRKPNVQLDNTTWQKVCSICSVEYTSRSKRSLYCEPCRRSTTVKQFIAKRQRQQNIKATDKRKHAKQKLVARDAPTNCQNEPGYPGLVTVLFSIRSPDMTCHEATKLCGITCPHEISFCKEWAK